MGCRLHYIYHCFIQLLSSFLKSVYKYIRASFISMIRHSIESILSACLVTLYGNCNALVCKALRRGVREAQQSPGLNCQPSKTSTDSTVGGRPRGSSLILARHPSCSSCHTEGTGASGPAPADSGKLLQAIRLLNC